MSKIQVASLVNDFGLGGTPRQIVTIDKYLNKDIFNHTVIGLNSGDNTRRKSFTDKNIFLCATPAEAAQVLKDNQVQLLHVHRHGRNEPAHDEIVRLWGVEHSIMDLNIFSSYDAGIFGQACDRHIFPSATNVWKYCIQNNLEFDFTKHNAVHTLFDSDNFFKHIPSSEAVVAYRQKLGIAPGAFVVGRLARPVIEKWDDQLLIMWKKLSRLDRQVHFVVLGVPESRKKVLQAIGDSARLTIVEPTSSDQELALFYASIDVLAHASPIGECSSGTILEAMFFQKPVVVTATPFPRQTGGRTHTTDNGQVEQIKNGENGYVVTNGTAMAKALVELAKNPKLLAEMGKKNAADVKAKFDASVGIRSFEKIYLESVARKGVVLSPEQQQYYNDLRIYPNENEIRMWREEYERRLSDVYPGGKNNFMDTVYLIWWKVLRVFKRITKLS